jgi:hypothetical protein
MYPKTLAAEAGTRGLTVHWYDGKTVLQAPGDALQITELTAYFPGVRKSVGPPGARAAMAAAIVAQNGRGSLAALRFNLPCASRFICNFI